TKQLHKLIDVIKVTDLTDEGHVERELVLIRVNAEPSNRAEILRTAEIFRARVVDVTPVSFVLEATGDEGKLEALLELLRTIAIIGYGSQGHAHALNLKDSGQDVVVGLYKGSKSWAKAEKEGLRVATVNEAAQMADVIMILLPDQSQRHVFETEIKGGLGK